ncbi:MFS transporter [Rhodococcoides kyotonense]|uniref:Drug resistance transporter, EmrB/QacA subfamily n=1 Tax=Rhodococcoides kyotonense TaxID=398843 RepID=A0A239MYP1_9NOCA|nr:drug resistance transporter, EmrB/QacA subfamily [Rhodococcus kyotonensis]
MACLGVFVAYLPVTTVAVSLPAIQSALNATTAQLAWVQDAFVLPMAAFILTAGVFSDVHGRKKVFVAGLLLSAAGSFVALSAQSVQVLWVGQALSGLAAAALLPTTLVFINEAVPDFRERGKFIGLWATSLMFSLTVGPIIAGTILAHFQWRWIYLLPIPVALASVATAIAVLPESRSPHPRRLDWGGQVSAALAISALVFAVIEGGANGFAEPMVLSALALAAFAIGAFMVLERRSSSPMLDLALFRSKAFTGTTLIAMITFLALIGFFFVLSLYFGMVQQLDVLEAGWRLALMSGASMVAGNIAGRLMHRISARTLITTGLVMLAAAQFSLLSLGIDTSFVSIAWRLVLLGVGMGLVMTPMTATAVSSVPYHLAGMAAAGNNAFRQVGGALGPAVLGALLTAGAIHSLPDKLAELDVPEQARRTVVDAVDTAGLGAVGGLDLGSLTGPTMTAVGEAFLDGLQICLIVSGSLTILAALAAVFMLRVRHRDAHKGN